LLLSLPLSSVASQCICCVLAALPPLSAPAAAAPWGGQSLVSERPEFAGDMNTDPEPHSLSQRLESIGQRPSMPSQRLDSLAGDRLVIWSSHRYLSGGCL